MSLSLRYNCQIVFLHDVRSQKEALVQSCQNTTPSLFLQSQLPVKLPSGFLTTLWPYCSFSDLVLGYLRYVPSFAVLLKLFSFRIPFHS